MFSVEGSSFSWFLFTDRYNIKNICYDLILLKILGYKRSHYENIQKQVHMEKYNLIMI